MAINPKTIKALFGKLAPYADDVAKGVVKYGDDVAEGVVKYGDDVARAAAKYRDDAALIADNAGRALPSLDLYDDDYLDALESIATHKPIPYTSYSPSGDGVMDLARNNYADLSEASKRVFDAGLSPGHLDTSGRSILPMANGDMFIDGKKFHYPYVNEYSPYQDWLKAHLMDKHTNTGPDSRVRDIFKRMPDTPLGAPAWTSMIPGNTPVLGDVVISNAYADGFQPVNSMSTALPKRIDTTGLIMQSPELPDASGKVFGLRPHKNTALGRWFAKNNPGYGWETYMYTYTDPFSGEFIKEYLPF